MKLYGKMPRIPRRPRIVGVAPKARRTCDGIVFASRGEMLRYQELRLLEKTAWIRDLRRQVSYDLTVNGQLVARYVADFTYWEDNRWVVEDAKGYETEVYRIKKKLMKACHGIEVLETRMWKRKGVGKCSTSRARSRSAARSGAAASNSSTNTETTGD